MSKIREAIHSIYLKKRELGITQEVIAQRIGCTQSFVSEMLSGDKHMNDDAIEGFCDALGVTLGDLQVPSTEIKVDEKDDLCRKLKVVLNKTNRSESVLKAAIEAAYREVRRKV